MKLYEIPQHAAMDSGNIQGRPFIFINGIGSIYGDREDMKRVLVAICGALDELDNSYRRPPGRVAPRQFTGGTR